MDAPKLTLVQSIQAHGQTVTELTFRPMTGKDMRVCGFPYSFSDEGARVFNMDVVSKMISTLAGIPPSAVDLLSPHDMTKALFLVMGLMSDEPAQAVQAGQAAA